MLSLVLHLLILTRNNEQIAPNDLIAQKRAEIAAKMAAMKKNVTGVSASIVAAPVPAVSASPTPATSGSSTPGVNDDLARRIAEIKKQVAVAHSKVAVRDNPYMVSLYASSIPPSYLKYTAVHATNRQEQESSCGAIPARRWPQDGCSSSSARYNYSNSAV
jgi:hypothetical protein